MKVGQVEFVWRSHRQAFVIKIGGEQRVFRFNNFGSSKHRKGLPALWQALFRRKHT